MSSFLCCLSWGQMAFMYSPSHMDTISFCFVEPPKIEMQVEAAVLQNKDSLFSRMLSKLVVFAVRTVLNKKLSLPCMKTKWFLNKVSKKKKKSANPLPLPLTSNSN